jgi:hypothetical protein
VRAAAVPRRPDADLQPAFRSCLAQELEGSVPRVGYLVHPWSARTKTGQVENGPAFSKRAVISVENMSGSKHLDARDQLKQAFGDVCLMGVMGSHPTSPTNLGGVGRFNRGGGKAILASR